MSKAQEIEKIARKLQRKFNYNRFEYSRNPDRAMFFNDMATEALYQAEQLGYRLPEQTECPLSEAHHTCGNVGQGKNTEWKPGHNDWGVGSLNEFRVQPSKSSAAHHEDYELTDCEGLHIKIVNGVRGDPLRIEDDFGAPLQIWSNWGSKLGMNGKGESGTLYFIKEQADEVMEAKVLKVHRHPNREAINNKAKDLSSGGTLHDDEGYIVLPPSKWQILMDYILSGRRELKVLSDEK